MLHIYFTQLLVEKSRDTYFQYSKSRLNKNYLEDRTVAAILAALPERIGIIIS